MQNIEETPRIYINFQSKDQIIKNSHHSSKIQFITKKITFFFGEKTFDGLQILVNHNRHSQSHSHSHSH